MAQQKFSEMSHDELLEYCRQRRKEGVSYYTLNHFFQQHHIEHEKVKYVVNQLDEEERKFVTEEGELPAKGKKKNLRWLAPVIQAVVGFGCLLLGFSLFRGEQDKMVSGLFFLVGAYALLKALINFVKLD